MDESQIVDLIEQDSDGERWKESVGWWERKRLLYNLIVVGTELFLMILYKSEVINYGIVSALLGSIIWTFLANICYSLGWGIEIFRLYYNLSISSFDKWRLLLLVTGITFSVLLTYLIYSGLFPFKYMMFLILAKLEFCLKFD